MSFMSDAPSDTPFLSWSKDYEVGIRRFDEEHARLAAIISHLHSTMIVRRDKEVSLQVFDRLILEARRHFDAETALMTDLGYPECEEHQLEHAGLLGEAARLLEQYKLGHISALALPTFLRKWLLEHIAERDRPCAGFFQGHGIR